MVDKPIRVLIVEDSEDDTLMLTRALRRAGYDPHCERVETAPAMADALATGLWDLVISDYKMPRFTALEALRTLQRSELDLPFMIVSGEIGEDTAVAAMKAGAHDYMMKDNLARLVPAVERELREAVERRQHREAQEELRQEAQKRRQLAQFTRGHERKKLSEELHDDTLASLASINMELGLLAHEAKRTSSDLEARISGVHQLVRESDRRLRDIVHGIFPSVLTNLGLAPAVRTYLEELSQRPIVNPAPLQIEFRASGFGSERLPDNLEVVLYRAIQLGVTNVVQDARATRLHVSLDWRDTDAQLVIADNGVGFDVGSQRNSALMGHFGLANLKDRIEAVQGMLSIESRPTAGTVVRGTIPLENPPSGAQV